MQQGGKRGRLVWVVMTAVITGCAPAPALPPDTGARDAAQRFCDALLARDWARAYAALHPESRARCSAKQFARLAEQYRRELGFEPEPARIRFCQEQGLRAIAHIIWKGQKGAHEHFYHETLILRSTQPGWGVVLPRRFGSGRTAPGGSRP